MDQHKVELLQQIQSYAERPLKNDTSGHSLDHLRRVVNTAKMILETEPDADTFLTLAAAWLHEALDDKLTPEPDQAREQLTAFLNRTAS